MELWDRLNGYADYISASFDKHFTRYDNEKYTDDLKFKDWNDTFWHSDQVSKAHLKTMVFLCSDA